MFAYSQGSFARILVARLKEPPENMLILPNICIAGVTLDVRVKLAYASWYLLVPHRDVRVTLLRDQVSRRRNELCQSRRCQQGRSEKLGRALHREALCANVRVS
jgi:hypothetical protein